MNQGDTKKIRIINKCLLGALFVSAPELLMASNGSNVIGFGHESLGLAGADIGYIRDTSAVSVNPAGLTHIENNRLDLHAGFTDAGSIRHSDMFGNDETQSNSPIPFGGGAAAFRLNDKLVLGVGLLAQGGSGVEYKNLNTAFNTTDNMKNTFSVSKLSIGLGYQATPKFSLGMSIDLYYAGLEQELFPNTSIPSLIPSQSFYGYRLENASTFSTAFRFGLQHQLTDRLLIGATYVTSSNLDIEDADIHFNFTGLGLGSVKYNANLSGLKQPQELGIGFSFLMADHFTLSMEANWIDWSSAFSSSTLTATNPDNQLAPASIILDTNYNWEDQYVLSAGIIYQPNTHLTIRGGINYAENPIPDENLSPLLPLIGERHVSVGVGYKFNKQLEINGTVVRDLPNQVTYTNTESVFGSDSVASYSGTLYLATLSMYWQ